jgi:hypothetical protein
MTKADIIDLLNKHSYIEDEIRNCAEEMQLLAETVACERDIKATLLSGMPGNPSTRSDPTYQRAQKILDDYKKDIERIGVRQEGLFERRNKVLDMIGCLDVRSREIVELRYVRKFRWDLVAAHTRYHEAHCRKVCKRALDILCEKYA